MVPVEVGLIYIVPCLGGDGGAHAQHVVPAAPPLARHQAQGSLVAACQIECIKQELRPIDAAGHAARLHIGGHTLHPVLGYHAECQGKHAAVLRAML